MSLVAVSRTDRLLRELAAQVERQRPLLDGGAAFSLVTIAVRLYPDGRVRNVRVFLESECESLSESAASHEQQNGSRLT